MAAPPILQASHALESRPVTRPILAFARALLGASLALVAGAAPATPYLPADDAQVLERLPVRAADPTAKALRELRQRLAAAPADADLAAELAGRYYRLAQREGDPRYVGYAQAVLTRWPAPADAPTPILLVRSLLAQFVHDFAGADRDLSRVLERHPDDLAARSYRAILNLVQARYAQARDDCRELAARSRALVSLACEPTVRAVTGEAEAAYRALAAALAAASDAPDNERFWVLTRLAEIAQRLGRNAQAEAHYRSALAMGIADQYLLATYAEFLLDARRPAEVVDLLRGQTRNDVLLLRLALAEQALRLPALAEHVATIAARIDAARRRGDELHLADEAVFALAFRKNPQEAVRLARRNWDSGQREPADARTLLEAGLAAKDAAAARPALDWLQASGHEDARLRALARQLGAPR